MIKRYMLHRNGKTIGFADTEKEAFEMIDRDLNVKKDFEYTIKDLQEDVYVDASVYVADEKKKARWAKQKKPKRPKLKRNDVVDDDYSKWLGTQPCVVTGQVAERGAGAYNMHCHHIHGRGGGRNDYMQVPLMGHVHTWGSKSYHSCTRADFIKHHSLMVDDVIEYFEDYARNFKGDYDAMKRSKQTKT